MHAKIARNLLAAAICAALAATGQSVEIFGSLQNAIGEPLGGTVDIIKDGPDLRVTSHVVEDDGRFNISADSGSGILVYASAEDHPPDERYIQPGASGAVRLDFVFPMAQELEGRVVDSRGQGVADAIVQVRYHEPNRPRRRTAFHELHSTDGDGYFMLSDVGIGVPFFVDVFAHGYRPVASPKTMRADGETQLEEIALAEEGGTVLVRVLDPSGAPVTDIQVVLLADPGGFRTDERGSILLSRAFNQQDSTSRFGNVRFNGVPPGRIRLHAMSPAGQAWTETRVDEKQILEIVLNLQ